MIDQKSPAKKNASEEQQFLRVGKEMPYKVPEGFFEAMPERTLQKAKVRFKNRKRRVFISSGFMVFAAAAAILAFVFLLPNRALKLENPLATVVKTLEVAPKNVEKSVQPKTELVSAKTVLEKEPVAVSEEENLEDILENLSEEDLSELLAEYRSDDLEENVSTELTNIN
jgi:hypothetical protein